MKHTKKGLLCISFVCAVVSALGLAACGETASDHEHSWSDWEVVTPATCTVDGERVRVCQDDESHVETEKIPAAHVYSDEWTEDVAATCTTAGSKSHHCIVCSDKKDVTEVAVVSTAHIYSEEWTVDIAATCMTAGSKSHHCTLCGDKKDVTEIAIDPTAHVYSDEWTEDVAATCTTTGSKSHHCTLCGDKKDVTKITELGHDFEKDFTVDIAATCVAAGSKSKHCTRCEATTEVTPIEAIGGDHNYSDEWTEDVAATCTTAGSKSHHCTRCGDKKDVTEIAIDPTAHSYSAEWTEDVAATCTAAGSKSHHCALCDDRKDVTEITALGHDHSEEWTVDTAATCTTAGSKSHHCTRCDDKADVSEVAIDPTAHDYSEEWTVDIAATCTTVGSKSHHCTRCNAAGEATEIAIDPTAHDYSEEWTEDTAATCTAAGSKSHHCNRCEVTTDVTEITALGHDYSEEWTEDTAATCSAAGSKSHHCTRCDDKKDVTEIPVLTDTLVEVAANTQTSEIVLPSGGKLTLMNTKYYQCSSCGKLFMTNTNGHEATDSNGMVNEIASAASAKINNTPYFGSVSLGKSMIRGGTRTCGILFQAPEAGTYRLEVGETNSNGLFQIEYFGKTEQGTTPCTVYTKASFWARDAAEFKRFTRSLEQPAREIYVTMDEGDVIGFAIALKKPGLEFTVEKATELPICQMHVAAYDFSSLAVDGGSLQTKCTACGAALTDTFAYDAGITVNTNNEATPEMISVGTAVVQTKTENTFFSFTPVKGGNYKIAIGNFDAATVALGTQIKYDGTIAAMNMGGTWYSNPPFDASSLKVSKNGDEIALILTDEQANKPITFSVNTTDASDAAPAHYFITVSQLKELAVGKNIVSITEANAMFIDCYDFTPTETKKYSMTVPEGVEVLKDDDDFLIEKRVANFEATKGVKITFAFKGTAVGSVEVTIGNEVKENLPILELTTDPTNAKTLSVTPLAKTLIAIRIADNVPAGKKYTVSMEGNFTMAKQTGYGSMYFTVSNAAYAADASLATMKAACDANPGATSDVMWVQTFTTRKGTTASGCEYDFSSVPWKVTFTLTAGSVLYFVPTAEQLPEGKELGQLGFTLTEAK